MDQMKSEVRDGMRIEWDVPIEMDDGTVLRADVFRPDDGGRYPVILSSGPYAKGLAFQEGFKSAWLRLTESFPEAAEGTSNKYQNWELVDPEKWVPDGFACVRVDSRGAGRSPGNLDIFWEREAKDLYDCVEWAGAQPWSNGKVGTNGISYYAMVGWMVGALNPPHLAAVCAWEGACDFYRELARHGGIMSDFLDKWYMRQVVSVQHGVGEQGTVSAVTGEPVAGPETLPEEELAANRADPARENLERELLDEYYATHLSPRVEDVRVPLLSAANWGGQGLHPRGNFEGFVRAGSEQKWLEVHGDTHFSHFYSDYGVTLQKRFFGHFLKGEDTGWQAQPRVALNVRRPGEQFELRAEKEWPLARTEWTRYYLQPDGKGFEPQAPVETGQLSFAATGDGLQFWTPPLERELEITGPVAAKLWVSSDTTDADIFVVLGVYDPDGNEVVFVGANDPRVPVGLGWLRASHRKLDPERSLPYRPYHSHDEKWALTPGEPVELDVEVWPTCIVVPAGYRIAMSIRGKDYEYDGTDAALAHAPYEMKGVGPFTHANQQDRPSEIFGGTTTLHFEPHRMPYVVLPVIPPA